MHTKKVAGWLQAFQKPEVGQAVMDISQNPANLVKYQDNPEVMKVCPTCCCVQTYSDAVLLWQAALRVEPLSGIHTSCQGGIIDVGGEESKLSAQKPPLILPREQVFTLVLVHCRC